MANTHSSSSEEFAQREEIALAREENQSFDESVAPKRVKHPVFKEYFHKSREKVWNKKRARVRLHRSFKRSYREEYDRPLELPGLLYHAMSTFKLIFKNWKVFCPLILFIAVSNIIMVGVMSEETYTAFQDTLEESSAQLAGGDVGTFAKSGLLLLATVTSGGLNKGMSDVQQVFVVFLFISLWLVTIYLLRHILAGHKPKMRDGLYNALTPFFSSLAIIIVIFLEIIPIMIVTITYSAAVQTEFLSTPFYALIYFIFAALLILLSAYLLSSSVMALIAVSAPGLYPMAALHTASDLMAGRRIKFIIRLVYLIFVVAIVMVLTMLPLIALDMWLKSFVEWLQGWPIVPLELLLVTCFCVTYATSYLYLYYRRMLAYEE